VTFLAGPGLATRALELCARPRKIFRPLGGWISWLGEALAVLLTGADGLLQQISRFWATAWADLAALGASLAAPAFWCLASRRRIAGKDTVISRVKCRWFIMPSTVSSLRRSDSSESAAQSACDSSHSQLGSTHPGCRRYATSSPRARISATRVSTRCNTRTLVTAEARSRHRARMCFFVKQLY